MPIYKCPRCRGSDAYFANRQELRSTGGPFSESYTVDVKKAFCRACGEPMDNLGPTPQEAKAAEEAIEKTIKFFTPFITIVIYHWMFFTNNFISFHINSIVGF